MKVDGSVRIAKWVAAILGGLVLLALLTVLTVTVFVDPNRFRGQIERAVTRATGQPFDIKGDLSISWFPWLAIKTGPSEFGTPEVLPVVEPPAPNPARSGTSQRSRGRSNASQPNAVQPNAPERGARGRGTGGPGAGSASAAQSDAARPNAARPIMQWQSARVGAKLVPLLKGQLIVDTIRLDGPTVTLVRHADGTSNWDSVLAAFRNRKAEPAKPEGPEGPPPGPQVSGFQLRKGTLTYVDERPDSQRTVSVSDWTLDVGEWRAGSTFPIETQLSLAIGNALRAQNLKLSTRLHVSDDANDIDLFGLDYSSLLFAKGLPAKGLPIELEVSRMAVRLAPLDIGISELSSRVAGVTLTTSIQAGQTGPSNAFYVRGPLDLQVPSVRELLKVFAIEAPLPLDKKTIGPMKLTSMMAWENGAITANAIELDLDETHFSGEASRTADVKPVWSFALHGNKIQLGPYLSLEDKSKEPFELPVRTLRALQVQGELTFDQAWMGATEMRGVKLRLELEDGKVRTASQ
jgi:AsmA protein